MIYIQEEQNCLLVFNPIRGKNALALNYNPFQIKQVTLETFKISQANFKALLGVKLIDDIPFMMLVLDSAPCCTFNAATITQIKSIGFLPIVHLSSREEAMSRVEGKLKEFQKLFNKGYFYYSDLYRLNETFLMNEKQKIGTNNRFYQQFIFNVNIMRTNESEALFRWSTPIIQGYVEMFTAPLPNNEKITCLLISRRSNKKAGTRYYARGIDDTGNVANFTETQQIVKFKDYVISHIQIRGSVPAFFEQLGISGLSGELIINRNQATTQNAFDAHFQKLKKQYSNIFCINLLSLKKQDEKKLSLFYQSLINKFGRQHIRYQYFDFHQQCKNNKFQNADYLIRQIHQVIDCFDCNIIKTSDKQIIRRQNGVMRTNCLDCLDRTNYVQSRIALYLMQKIIKSFSDHQMKELMFRSQTFVNKHQKSSQILQKFNSCWADNGDSISLHYTGTGSTHTDITKNGKRTLKGTVTHKMKSLMRFFVQFTDEKKHEAIHDMVESPLLHKSTINFSNNIYQHIDATILSFEIPKQSQTSKNMNNFFTQDYIIRKRPQMVVIFGYIEEDKSFLNFLKMNKKSKQLQFFIQQKVYTVRRLGYQLFSEVKNEHSCLLVFGNEIVVPNLSQIKQDCLQKHKNSILISKFNIFNSSMVLSGVNCSDFNSSVHLIEKAHEQAFQINKLGQAKSSSILTKNYKIVVGNLSSGSDLSKEELQEMRAQLRHVREVKDEKGEIRLINRALDHDWFSQKGHQKYLHLRNYMEGPAYFIPGSNRIIFWNKENLIIKVLEYQENSGQSCIYGHFRYEIQ